MKTLGEGGCRAASIQGERADIIMRAEVLKEQNVALRFLNLMKKS